MDFNQPKRQDLYGKLGGVYWHVSLHRDSVIFAIIAAAFSLWSPLVRIPEFSRQGFEGTVSIKRHRGAVRTD
jgi:hypothetical protein